MRTAEPLPNIKSLEDATLTDEIKLKAERELNETDDKKEKCLQELKVLLKGEKNLIANTSDEFLLKFLRAKKFRTKMAFSTLKKFYNHRVLYPSIYYHFSPKQNLKVLQANICNFLPIRASDGSAIWAVRLGTWDPKDIEFAEALRFGILCHEKVLQNPVTQICGITSIVDLEGFAWSHLSHLPPSVIKSFISASQDCLPIRHKAIHIINNPNVFGIVFALMKPFLTYKIINRIYFHGCDLASLHQHLPPCLLPEEFGGTQGPFKNEQFYNSLLEAEEHFLKEQKYGYVCECK